MFASELAKPTSICLGAFEGQDLVGYVINSRYVDAWHVMNVAVDPEHQRRGVATALLERLFELTRDDERRGYTLEVRVSNEDAIRPLREARLRIARHPARLLHGQPGRRADHVARRTPVILGIETRCDETAAAVVTWDGEIVSSVVASQDELHARFGGVVPEVASRRHLDLIAPVIEEVLTDGVEAIAVTSRPGLIGALLVGVSAAKALAWARRLPLRAREPPARARRVALPAAARPAAAVHLPARERRHTMLLDVQERGGYTVLGTTLDDAAGEAFDKGARLLGLGYPGGKEIDALAKQGDPTAYDFPVARVPGLDFSFSGPQDRAALQGARPPAAGARGAPRRPRGELPAGDRPRARRAARGGRRRPDRGRRRCRRQLGAARRAA